MCAKVWEKNSTMMQGLSTMVKFLGIKWSGTRQDMFTRVKVEFCISHLYKKEAQLFKDHSVHLREDYDTWK